MVNIISQLFRILLLCLAGFEYSVDAMNIAEIREVMHSCAMDGGFCINTIPLPPPAPPRRRQPRPRQRPRLRKGPRPGGGPRRGKPKGLKPPPGKAGPKGKTRPPHPAMRGPPPVAMAPAPAPAAPAPVAPAPVAPQAPVQQNIWQQPAYQNQPWNQPSTYQQQQQQQQQQLEQSIWSWFDPMTWSLFSRKKRQAVEGGAQEVEPGEGPGEGIRRRHGESMVTFLMNNCAETQRNFGCQKTGGICCFKTVRP